MGGDQDTKANLEAAKRERARWLERVRAATDLKELAACYDQWGADYERQVVACGYLLPAVICGMLARYVPAGAGPILDAGAGTGILGASMALLGYRDLVALDISTTMLAVAAAKKVYTRHCCMALGGPLDFPDGSFAAVVAMGVFLPGHAPPESFDELIRITRPGGHLVFSIPAETGGEDTYLERQRYLEGRGEWRLLAMTDPFVSLLLWEPPLYNRVLACRRR